MGSVLRDGDERHRRDITVRSYALIVPPETLDSFLRFAAAVYRRHSIRLGTPTWSSPSAWTRRLMRLLGREDW